MATIRQQNWLGQQRVDVPHLRSVESGVAADFDALVGKGLTGDVPVVLRGFTVVMSPSPLGSAASLIQVQVAEAVLWHPTAQEPGSLFWVPADAGLEQLISTNPSVSGSFTPSAVNYVGLDLVRAADDTTTDTVKFIDADTDTEVSASVPLARTLSYRLVISTVPFALQANVCPLALVTTNASNVVTAVADARPLMWRLGTGGDVPDADASYAWPGSRLENALGANVFGGGDKDIPTLKAWADAVMSRIQEIGGGTHWYRPTADRNVRLARDVTDAYANGDQFEVSGGNLHWRGLRVLFDNGDIAGQFYAEVADQLGDSAGLTDLAVGDCIYVDLVRGAAAPPTLVPVKAALSSLGQSAPVGQRWVIAWRDSLGYYSRDGQWAIGFGFPVATDAVLGVVQLSYAAGTPATPTVVPLDVNEAITVTATGGNSFGIKGTGNGTGNGLWGVAGGGAASYGVLGTGTAGAGSYGVRAQGINGTPGTPGLLATGGNGTALSGQAGGVAAVATGGNGATGTTGAPGTAGGDGADALDATSGTGGAGGAGTGAGDSGGAGGAGAIAGSFTAGAGGAGGNATGGGATAGDGGNGGRGGVFTGGAGGARGTAAGGAANGAHGDGGHGIQATGGGGGPTLTGGDGVHAIGGVGSVAGGNGVYGEGAGLYGVGAVGLGAGGTLGAFGANAGVVGWGGTSDGPGGYFEANAAGNGNGIIAIKKGTGVAVAAQGDVQVLNTDNFKYLTAVTRYFHSSPIDWVIVSGSTTFTPNSNSPYISCNNNPTNIQVCGRLVLPAGATVTDVAVFAANTDGGNRAVTVTMASKAYNGADVTDGYTDTSSGALTTANWANNDVKWLNVAGGVTAPTDGVVIFTLTSDAITGADTFKIYGVRFTYTHTLAVPAV